MEVRARYMVKEDGRWCMHMASVLGWSRVKKGQGQGDNVSQCSVIPSHAWDSPIRSARKSLSLRVELAVDVDFGPDATLCLR